jgi:hypothetical protein
MTDFLLNRKDLNILFDITSIQEAFRDEINIDVLFIIAACKGGHMGWEDAPGDHDLEHRVEIFSVGESPTCVTGTDKDFLQLVAAELRWDANRTMIVEEFAKGVYKRIFRRDLAHHTGIGLRPMHGKRPIILSPMRNTELESEGERGGE